MCTRRFPGFLMATAMALAFFTSASADTASALKVISGVGLEGAGNVDASKAVKELSAAKASSLTTILAAMKGTNDLAANWLRAAVETIAARELQAGRKLPLADLEKFLANQANPPRARRLAFEIVARVDPARGENLIAGMINDPAPELRRDAVGRRLQAATALKTGGKTNEARVQFKELLPLARDVDQVDAILKDLKTMGEPVNLAQTFGFITQWKVAGPFDSVGGKGFAAVYPPEQAVDLAAEYDGKSGKVRWQNFTSKDDYGFVSMNLPYKPLKGVAAYAYSEFFADKALPVELRLGSQNGFKVWLNGQFLFGQEEYHRNKVIDQYRIPARLKPGRNVLLVKVCQNEQTEDWAGDWDFQIRVCDPLGTPIHSANPAKP